MKMWDAKHRTLLHPGRDRLGQPGRARSAATTTCGGFREAGRPRHRHADRFVSHRPVFRAAPPGHPISPNLVGRVSAAFALAAQQDAGDRPGARARELRQARLLYARAATGHPPHPLVTALPHAFYPESTWRDDMQLGAAEIALAAQRLGQPAGALPRATAPHWARGFIAEHEHGHAQPLRHGRARGLRARRRHGPRCHTAGSRSSRADLVARPARPDPTAACGHARHDPFGAAESPCDEFDANSHTFGLIATVALYDRLTHSRRFQRLRDLERTWLLGGDPWGVGAMVGVGTRSRSACSTRSPTSRAPSTAPADRRRRGRQRPERRGQLRGRPRRLPGRHAALHRRRPQRSTASTATAAGTSTTSAPGRPTSPRWT